MKGFADIVLYDKDGNIVKEQYDNNLITDAFKEYLEAHNAIVNNPISRIGDEVRNCTNGMTLQKLIGGIVLFENKLPEDPKIIHNNIMSLASAGTSYDYTNPLRGSLNTQETGAAEIDGKQAYRWVWDFGTANANCTFNAVCLTTRYAGDRNYRLRIGTDMYGASNKLEYNYSWKLGNDYNLIAYDKNGRRIVKNNGRIEIGDYLKTKKITDNGDLTEYKVVSPTTHQWFSKNTHVIDNVLYFIAKNINTEEFELLGLDLNTLTTISSIELTEVKNSITSTIDMFGFCGKDTIVFNPYYSSGILHMSFFNLTTKEYMKNVNTGQSIAGEMRTGTFCSYKTINGEFGSTLTTYTTAGGNRDWDESWAMFNILNTDNVNTMFVDRSETGYGGDSVLPGVRMFNNTSMLCSYTTAGCDGNTKRGGMIWPAGQEPLFTINNLQAPITKTEANTMKITYTLVFE